jgi:hypothetical protein
MTLQEKNLYQQIHPVRLITDWSCGIGACVLFWLHELWLAVGLSILPSLLVSLIVFRLANLEKIKESRFGRYFKRTFNKTVDLLRFSGFVLLAIGSWVHFLWIMGLGMIIIIGTWSYGLLIRK